MTMAIVSNSIMRSTSSTATAAACSPSSRRIQYWRCWNGSVGTRILRVITGNTAVEVHRLATWLRASVVDVDEVRPLRLAFMGRTSDDEVQDPTISIPRQLRSARSVLSPGMESPISLPKRADRTGDSTG